MEQVIGSKPVETEKKGVFSNVAISGASFIGGPFVGGWMLGENFKELGRPDLAKKYKIGGTVLFVALVIIAQFVDSKTGFGLLSPALAWILFERYQKKDVEAYITNGGIKRKKWPKACIIFTVIVYVLVILSLALGLVSQYYLGK